MTSSHHRSGSSYPAAASRLAIAVTFSGPVTFAGASTRFIGFPISFTMLFLAFVFGYLGLGEVVFDLAYFQTIGLMKEEVLAAVPLFIFMAT